MEYSWTEVISLAGSVVGLVSGIISLCIYIKRNRKFKELQSTDTSSNASLSAYRPIEATAFVTGGFVVGHNIDSDASYHPHDHFADDDYTLNLDSPADANIELDAITPNFDLDSGDFFDLDI